MTEVLIIGGGLAGTECAWQLAQRGIHVDLWEQRPAQTTPAHDTGQLAELVCSNSLRGAALANAVGVLKEELRRAGSLLIAQAVATRVPAGGALAVDRAAFSQAVTTHIDNHPNITVTRRHANEIPDHRPCVLATGPLTSDDLAQSIAQTVGHDALAYYDAIAPIIAADSIDWSRVFRQSRYDREDDMSGAEPAYVNCPMDQTEYETFLDAMREADQVQARDFEDARFFEGCLPVEVMAQRGPKTLTFGPMKPVGLTNPHTGRRPFAVVQLRAENREGTAYNLVGFQTRLRQPEQRRVFRLIPGLEKATFLRYGAIHRNTFVDAPRALDDTMKLRGTDGVYLAGQMTGVEGYVESIASGLLCGLMLADRLQDRSWIAPPAETTLGGLLGHLRNEQDDFQPSNITWAHLPDVPGVRGKANRKAARSERALKAVDAWLAQRAARQD